MSDERDHLSKCYNNANHYLIIAPSDEASYPPDNLEEPIQSFVTVPQETLRGMFESPLVCPPGREGLEQYSAFLDYVYGAFRTKVRSSSASSVDTDDNDDKEELHTIDPSLIMRVPEPVKPTVKIKLLDTIKKPEERQPRKRSISKVGVDKPRKTTLFKMERPSALHKKLCTPKTKV